MVFFFFCGAILYVGSQLTVRCLASQSQVFLLHVWTLNFFSSFWISSIQAICFGPYPLSFYKHAPTRESIQLLQSRQCVVVQTCPTALGWFLFSNFLSQIFRRSYFSHLDSLYICGFSVLNFLLMNELNKNRVCCLKCLTIVHIYLSTFSPYLNYLM